MTSTSVAVREDEATQPPPGPTMTDPDPWGRSVFASFRRWGLIPVVLAVVLAGGGWLAGTLARPSARAQLIVLSEALDGQGMERDTESAGLTLSTAAAFDRAAERAGVEPADLRSRARIGSEPRTQIVTVVVTASTTQQAVRDANAIVDSALAAGSEQMAGELANVTEQTQTLIREHKARNDDAEEARLTGLGTILADQQTAVVASASQLDLLQRAEPARSVPTPPVMAALGALAGVLLGLAWAQLLGIRRGTVTSGRELSRLYPQITVVDPVDLESMVALEPEARTVLLAGVGRSAQDLEAVTETVRRSVAASGRDLYLRDATPGRSERTPGQVQLIPTTLSEAVVRRTERDHASLLIVVVQPGITRLEALHRFAMRLTDRTYVLVHRSQPEGD